MTEERRRFHFDKTVSIGHIITTISVLVAVITGWKDMDKRVSLVELAVSQQKITDQQQDSRAKEYFDNIRSDVRDINSKLDRLIERTK